MLSEIKEPLYKLKDLMNDPIPGFYYKQDLTKAPKPSDDDYFLVEKTLKTKIVKKEKFYLIKVISDLAFPHFVHLIFVFCVTIFCNLYCCRPRSNLKFIGIFVFA